jgi:hypothetical protein
MHIKTNQNFAMDIKEESGIFWDVTMCSPVEIPHRFTRASVSLN